MLITLVGSGHVGAVPSSQTLNHAYDTGDRLTRSLCVK